MRFGKVFGLFFFIQSIVLCAIAPCAMANTLFVGSEYRTINEAVDDASYGDVICVARGTYKETIVMKEGLTLLGEGRLSTTIDAEADAIAIKANSGCRIAGFSIVEGIIGIDCIGAGVVIEDNYIQSRYVGIRSQDTSPEIFNNTIEAVYMCVVTKGSGTPHIYNNKITGRYVGIWAEYTSPLVHNNKIADFEHGVYMIGSNAELYSNKVLNSLYDGVVITSGSNCTVRHNAIVGHYERGVSIFDSSPVIEYNIISDNLTGVFSHAATPTLSHNCVGSNREADYDGISPGSGDIQSDPLMVGTGFVSSIGGTDYDTLYCTGAQWKTNSLVGLDLVPNTSGMYMIYGGQFRTFEVLSNTRTSITVAVDTTEAAPKTLYKCGSTEDYTEPGDRFFVDDVNLQSTSSDWPANSPCWTDNIGIYGGEYAGDAGPMKAPLVMLESDEQIYDTDETVAITAVLTNNQPEAITVDLHIIAFIEGSPTFFSYPNWVPGFNPVSYFLGANDIETIDVLEIIGEAIPQANYKMLAAFTNSGTFEIISPISELWFRVSND
ncbi:MAG: right-handed parallel beta-helix repeat-containing protein [Candidatus Coatesbacteria bacterium]|nr:right-handed parallel beta-helix repeat-containing protein [Candidatus Coatesbacteria bacterium]